MKRSDPVQKARQRLVDELAIMREAALSPNIDTAASKMRVADKVDRLISAYARAIRREGTTQR